MSPLSEIACRGGYSHVAEKIAVAAHPGKLLPARMNTKPARDQQACERQYHSSMELYRHGDFQRRAADNVVFLIRKERR
jgi:hypothetical protein